MIWFYEIVRCILASSRLKGLVRIDAASTLEMNRVSFGPQGSTFTNVNQILPRLWK